MADATATVVARMGLGQISDADGQPLGFHRQSHLNTLQPVADAFQPSTAEIDEAKVAARLRRLGYIE